jgi:hypothetical protein
VKQDNTNTETSTHNSTRDDFEEKSALRHGCGQEEQKTMTLSETTCTSSTKVQTPPPTVVIPSQQCESISKSSLLSPEVLKPTRDQTLSKNMISPILPKESSQTGSKDLPHGTKWPDPKASVDASITKTPACKAQGVDECDRIVAQRDAKIIVLQKQIDVLKASLREQGFSAAERALSEILKANDHSTQDLAQLRMDLDEARKEIAHHQADAARQKEQHAADMLHVRKVHEEVVRENAVQQKQILQLEETLCQREDALLDWQRSHGNLEQELKRAVELTAQAQKSYDNEREELSKQSETLHRSVLEHTKQQDALRKDRDSLAAELQELRTVLKGHEGVVAKMQAGREEVETARERLLQELETTQTEANSLREEIVMLQREALNQQASKKMSVHQCACVLVTLTSVSPLAKITDLS